MTCNFNEFINFLENIQIVALVRTTGVAPNHASGLCPRRGHAIGYMKF